MWLASISVVEGTGETCAPLSDRDILIALHGATNGTTWDRREGWLTDRPLGEWYGVTVNRKGRVSGVYVSGNNLTGALPPELEGLSELRRLALFGNSSLTGEIPPELGNLATLQDLYLNGNALTGEIPPELGNLATLQDLYLNGNALTGEIPVRLGKLTRLRSLILTDNALSGGIPSELGSLTSLTRLAGRG